MYLDEIKIHTRYDLPPVVIEKDRVMEFAKLYDPLPLHLEEDYARNSRFGALIAPGVMSFMSVWAEFVKMDIFQESLIAGKSTKIEWLLPVYIGDTLTGTAEITNITPRNTHNGIAEITVFVYNQKGQLVLTDVTESVVAYRPQ